MPDRDPVAVRPALLIVLCLCGLAVVAFGWGADLLRVWTDRADNPLLRRAAEARVAARDDPELAVHKHVLFRGPVPVGLAPSANLSAGNHPRLVVLHYTVSGSAGSALRWMRWSGSGVSAHLLIDRDGRITQLVPFDYQAWHAGRSRWRGETRLNGKSIGIELVNWGPLRRAPDGRWRSVKGRRVPTGQVEITSDDRGAWHRYSDRQIRSLISVLRALGKAYPIAEVLGHEDIAPGRKTDPGPAFPWQHLKPGVRQASGLNAAASTPCRRPGELLGTLTAPTAAPYLRGCR